MIGSCHCRSAPSPKRRPNSEKRFRSRSIIRAGNPADGLARKAGDSGAVPGRHRLAQLFGLLRQHGWRLVAGLGLLSAAARLCDLQARQLYRARPERGVREQRRDRRRRARGSGAAGRTARRQARPDSCARLFASWRHRGARRATTWNCGRCGRSWRLAAAGS
jgi:hypothetical protein